MLKRVLFAWELGNGLGHLGRFQPLFTALNERGIHCSLAQRELDKVHSVFGSDMPDMLQAPMASSTQTEARSQAGYADSLGRHGYGDVTTLMSLLNAWLKIFAANKPQLLIADYAPTALLAARIANIPVALYGCTFARPPSTDPLPVYRWWQPGYDLVSTRTVEQQIVNVCNAALGQHAATPIDKLAELFEAKFDWLTTIPELDHYGTRGTGEFIGPVSGLMTGAAPCWPGGSGSTVFVYLRNDAEIIRLVLSQLRKHGARVIIYAPNGFEQNDTGIHVSRNLLDLSRLCDEADYAVCHVGIVAEQFILAGKPVLTLPITIEQQLRARRIAEAGAGLLLTVNSASAHTALDDAVSALFENKNLLSSAQTIASRYKNGNQQAVIERIAHRIMSE